MDGTISIEWFRVLYVQNMFKTRRGRSSIEWRLQWEMHQCSFSDGRQKYASPRKQITGICYRESNPFWAEFHKVFRRILNTDCNLKHCAWGRIDLHAAKRPDENDKWEMHPRGGGCFSPSSLSRMNTVNYMLWKSLPFLPSE